MKFLIEQYELHATKYEVEAKDRASAIKKVLDGEAQAIDNGTDYIEVAEDFGMPAEENSELVEALEALDVECEHVIPSIRSIEEI